MGFISFISKFTKQPTLEDHLLFEGKYHDGNVCCEYVLRNGEKVFDGPFSYKYKYGSVFSNKGFETAEGTFSMNRKHGAWRMAMQSKQRKRELLVDFNQGRVEGSVEYRWSERDYLGRTTTNVLVFKVADGHVVGEIRGLFNGKKLTGFCDEEGYPDGQWMIDVKSDDVSLSHVDCEMWSHGKLMSSYSKMTKSKRQSDLNPYLRKTFSDLVNGDLLELLFIVRRGTHINRIEIPYHQ